MSLYDIDTDIHFHLLGKIYGLSFNTDKEETALREKIEKALKKRFKEGLIEKEDEQMKLIENQNIDPIFKYRFISFDNKVIIKIGFSQNEVNRILCLSRKQI